VIHLIDTALATFDWEKQAMYCEHIPTFTLSFHRVYSSVVSNHSSSSSSTTLS
jgi:hypothetical protein